MKINQKLYELAKCYVEKVHQKELKAEIRDVYEQFLYNSQRRKITPEERKEFQKWLKLINSVKIRGMGDSYKMHSLRGNIEDILKAKECHPKELKEILSRVKDRLRYEQSCLKS